MHRNCVATRKGRHHMRTTGCHPEIPWQCTTKSFTSAQYGQCKPPFEACKNINSFNSQICVNQNRQARKEQIFDLQKDKSFFQLKPIKEHDFQQQVLEKLQSNSHSLRKPRSTVVFILENQEHALDSRW